MDSLLKTAAAAAAAGIVERGFFLSSLSTEKCLPTYAMYMPCTCNVM